MSNRRRRYIYGALILLVLTTLGLSFGRQKTLRRESLAPLRVALQSMPGAKEPPSDDRELEQPSLDFEDQDTFEYQGYKIERRRRKALADSGEDGKNLWVDVNYITVKSATRSIAIFDADYYFGAGNSANFGLYPFLGGNTKQLFISQDVFRGGCQWVVSLAPRFKVIFDGRRLSVGREADDLRAVDLDNDGIYEIIAPITDFYMLQDKMHIGAIPLPNIVFRYEPSRETYLPANSKFRDYVSKALRDVPRPNEEFQHRSAVLSNLLTYIYLGEAEQGWDSFDKSYLLPDKEEMRRRTKKILRRQPVYQLIYHCGKGNRNVACRF